MQGGNLLGDAMVWLSVPPGIAVWTFFGPGRPDDATAPPPHIWRPINLGISFVAMGIGIVALVVGCYVHELGLEYGFPTWTLADNPFHYIGELARRALRFGYGLWLVFGPWDGGKSTKRHASLAAKIPIATRQRYPF